MNRRDFLRTAVVPLAGGCSLLRAGDADAQAGGYRALVCLFLFGGNDGINSMPPVDTDGYGRYSSVRRGLAVPRADIVQLDASYGLHPGAGTAQADLGRKPDGADVQRRPVVAADDAVPSTRNGASGTTIRWCPTSSSRIPTSRSSGRAPAPKPSSCVAAGAAG